MNDRRRIRRLILFGIPVASLLWAGCQRLVGYSDEFGYCNRLRYFLLSDYQFKHHQWPTSLDDVERDLEANACKAPDYLDDTDNPRNRESNLRLERTFQKYRPVMTVRWKTPSEIGIQVRFTRFQSFESGVDANSAIESNYPVSIPGEIDEKPAIATK